MNGYVIAGFLLALILTGFVAYGKGRAAGELTVTATVATAASNASEKLITKANEQAKAANDEAIKLRSKAAKLEVAHEQSTRALQAALARLAVHDSCVDHPVAVDLVRELTRARDHAAAQATTGALDAALPKPTGVNASAHLR